ncbi:unnamed protein product [Toxocara canis]|uniref:SER_THR_PHOSPHATASE domain-containing protein n=1 Tax=Toxocara canis TaxID=6265 RepID=A0A183VCK5_TOXCA|nr:unnamed protein product [Toxocara canis]
MVSLQNGFKFLPFAHPTAQNNVLGFLLSIIIFTLFYAYWKNRAHRRSVRSDYNTCVDEALLTNNDPFSAIQRTGRCLDGRLSSSELHAVFLLLASKRTKQMPSVQDGDDLSKQCAYVSNEIHQATGYDHLVVIREFQSKYESLLWRMIEQGPGFFRLEPIELRDLFEEVSDIFDSESSLLELPSDIVIIGDLRGRYCDLMRWFQLHGFPPKRRYLFLGGIVDNDNDDSIETITLIAALKRMLPYDVFILRGVTEYLPYRPRSRFPKGMCNALQKLMARMFDAMPLAALISCRILAVHSGIDEKMNSLKSIKSILRPLKGSGGELPRGIIFNLPHSEFDGFKRIKGSRGRYFGENDVKECVDTLGLSLIVRSRNPCPNGCFLFGDNRMLSIWSNNGHGIRIAKTLSISDDMQISLHSLKDIFCDESSSQAQSALMSSTSR